MENKFFFVRKREISGLGSDDWNFFQRREFCAEKAALEDCLFCCVERLSKVGSGGGALRHTHFRYASKRCAFSLRNPRPLVTEDKLFFFLSLNLFFRSKVNGERVLHPLQVLHSLHSLHPCNAVMLVML